MMVGVQLNFILFFGIQVGFHILFHYISLGRRDRKCPKIEPGELSHFLVLNNENRKCG